MKKIIDITKTYDSMVKRGRELEEKARPPFGGLIDLSRLSPLERKEYREIVRDCGSGPMRHNTTPPANLYRFNHPIGENEKRERYILLELRGERGLFRCISYPSLNIAPEYVFPMLDMREAE